MIGWFVILVGLYFSWRQTDLANMTAGSDLIAPLFFLMFCIVAIVKWCKFMAGGSGSGGVIGGTHHGGTGSSSSSSGGDSGGDGGCG